ncbi:MAG: capsular biosynthesis protein [Bacteroidaceae bacterium]|nr:capsular biosynthesis protein [Bacteroidaceae bacterium]
MWPFTSTTELAKSSILKDATDWHSHILPGVDDGVQTLEDSLKILDIYEKLGITKVWLTPHIMEDMPNTIARLKERFAYLKENYKGAVQLCLAAENMLDTLFEKRFEQNELLPIGDEGNCLLVETSYFNPPIDLYGMLDAIKSKGYYPILAHPERYVYMDNKDYDRLRDMDVRLQLNMGSLIGRYGDTARKKANYLLKNDMYSYYGSDVHTLKCLTSSLSKNLSDKTLEKVGTISPPAL